MINNFLKKIKKIKSQNSENPYKIKKLILKQENKK